jgi:hypothetical protein
MRYRVADHGRVFSTRDRGAQILSDFSSFYDQNGADTIVLDFAGVLSMTPSFADEFVGELLARSARGEIVMPALENLDVVPLRSVERCARARRVDWSPELAFA